MTRAQVLGLIWLFVLSCTQATESVFFQLGGSPELRQSAGLFEIGCPDGWSYSDQGPLGLVFRPPEPLPGGIDSFIYAVAGAAVAQPPGSNVSDAPDAFVAKLEGRFRAQHVEEERIGLWHGESALWFRGRIKEKSLTGDDTEYLDGFVAAVKGASGGRWLVFVLASYPADVYSDAFSQTVEGFRPLANSLVEYEKQEIIESGECSGFFSEVSPPPYQRIKAFIVSFNRIPFVEVTDKVVCKPRPAGETACQLLDAISGLSGLPGKGYWYRIDIWPTASAQQVRAVRKALEKSADIASFKVKMRP